MNGHFAKHWVCVAVDAWRYIHCSAFRSYSHLGFRALGLGRKIKPRTLILKAGTRYGGLELVTECHLALWMQAVADLQRLFELVGAYGFSEWLVFDASIIRGLAYYTGKLRPGFILTLFEI